VVLVVAACYLGHYKKFLMDRLVDHHISSPPGVASTDDDSEPEVESRSPRQRVPSAAARDTPEVTDDDDVAMTSPPDDERKHVTDASDDVITTPPDGKTRQLDRLTSRHSAA